MKVISEDEIIECRDVAAHEGIVNSSFQLVLNKAHDIYREGWQPVYVIFGDDDMIGVIRADPNMLRAN